MTISVGTAVQLIEAALRASGSGFVPDDVPTIISWFTQLNDAATVDDAIAILDDIVQNRVSTLNFAEQPQFLALATALHTAYTTDEVAPDETINAIAWVLSNGGIEAIAATTQSDLALAGWFALWAVEQEKPVATAPPVVAPTPPGDITVGVTVPEPATPGGKIVAAAEKLIKKALVKVPGLSANAAKGISTALAMTYEDALAVTVSVTNQVESDINAVEVEANRALDAATNTATALTKLQNYVDNRLHIDEQRISNILSADQTFQKDLTNLQKQITDIIDGATKLTEYATTAEFNSLQSEENATQSDLSNYATTGALGDLQSSLDALRTEVHLIELGLVGLGTADLATALAALEAEVASTAAVTDAITQGGATIGLLARLGGLLGLAGALGVAASIVSGLAAIFDLDDSITGTFWTAEVISGYAARAANVAIADTSWSRTMAVTVD